jgi:hypothetical protein
MWSLHADRDPAMAWLEVHLALASQGAFLAPNSARFLLPRIKTRDRLAARFQLVDQFMADLHQGRWQQTGQQAETVPRGGSCS